MIEIIVSLKLTLLLIVLKYLVNVSVSLCSSVLIFSGYIIQQSTKLEFYLLGELKCLSFSGDFISSNVCFKDYFVWNLNTTAFFWMVVW